MIAFRQLLKNPGFTTAAVLTLAICLGANLTILAVVDAMLVRALPFSDPERLAIVYNSYPAAGVDRVSGSLPNYFDRRGAIPAFASVSIYQESSAIIGEAEQPRRAPILRVSPEFFSTLGVPLAMGRAFTEEQLAYRADMVAVVTDEFWRSHFNADPNVIGRSFANDGDRVLVIGVLPRGFRFLSSQAQFFRPASHAAADRLPNNRHSGDWNMIARLAPGVTWSEAQSQMDVFNARQALDDPHAVVIKRTGYVTRVVPLREDHIRTVRRTIILLQAGVIVLLVIGVVNLANLLFVRANGRAQELAVRQALGASPWKLARGTVTEMMVLAGVAGLAALGIAAGGLRMLTMLGADRLPLGMSIQFDPRLCLAGLLLAFAVGVVLSILQVTFTLRMKLATGLKLVTRGGTIGRGAQRLQGGFVVVQIALAFVLLSSAGLLGVSLKRVIETPLGFDAAQLMAGRVVFPWRGYTNQALRIAFVEQVLTEVRSIPGVTDAAANDVLPLVDGRSDYAVAVEGFDPGSDSVLRAHHVANVTPGYWRVMGIPLLRGRLLEEADRVRPLRACVVDQAMVDRYWPGEDPIGRRLSVGTGFAPENSSVVVGVVANAKQADVVELAAQGTVYRPYGSAWPGSFSLVVRSVLPSDTLAPLIRAAVAKCDPGMPIDGLRSLQSRVDDSLVARRSPAILAGVFAAVALLLASLGTYGVLAYAVSQRQREIGVRMALGAQPVQVLAQFLGIGTKLCLIGLALGAIGTWATGRAMQSLLFGVGAFSPGIILLAGAALATVVSLASLIPSRRASRVDPMVALRSE